MNKLNKVLIGLVLLLLIVSGGLVYWQYFRRASYYAVLLKTGDMYFGRLSLFFGTTLKDAYLIRQNPNTEDKQNPFVLQKFSDAFWGPTDRIKLNLNEVVWTVKLRPDSQVANFIKTSAGAVPQGQPTQTAPSVPQIPTGPSRP